MAVVRFSEELKEAIVANATGLFHSKLEAAQKSWPQIGDEIISKLMADIMPTINLLPREFFQWHDTMDIEKIGGTSYGIRYRLAQSYPAPRSKVQIKPGVYMDGSYLIDLYLPATDEFLPYKEQLDQWKANIAAVEKQRDEFVAGVKQVINAHSTLAPALKAWPPLWDLVPEGYKERHRKVVERTKSDAPELSVDLNKLTSTVVASKLVK